MKYRRLSPTGDYTFGFGNSSFLTDADAVCQAIQTKLKMFKGEWWENINDGLPLFQQIAGRAGISAADLLIQSRILETPGVTSIATFTSSMDSNRHYYANITVDTAYGETQAVEVNL